MNNIIRLLIADDHAMVREMLRSQLDSQADMDVIGTANDGEQAVELARKLNPDVVLLDIDMPGQLCFVAAKDIKHYCPGTRILFVSAFSHDRYIDEALKAKATGYLTKDENPDVLMKAIRLAASGQAYFSPKIQERIVVDSRGLSLTGSNTTRASTLTQRELETVRYIARGLANKEIAMQMHVTVKTVDRHTQNAMDKLAIHNRVELARFAIREGLAEA